MKAYKVYDNYCNEPSTIIVFAETVNQAKKTAMSAPEMECADYIDLRVKRAKQLDKYYDGNDYWDWNDMKYREILVKEIGMYCLDPDMTECEKCSAKEYCSEYEYLMDEYLMEESENV